MDIYMYRACLNSEDTTKATLVTLMLLWVFKSREKLFRMKMTKNNNCLACTEDKVETLFNLLIQCDYFKKMQRRIFTTTGNHQLKHQLNH